MAQKKKFYITTPIYYVNDRPHIGHAYTTIAADTLARFKRMQGYDVMFLCGTDENSEKNAISAKKQNLSTKEYVDQMSALWQQTWDSLGISFNDFIRTTEDRHVKSVYEFFKCVEKSGDIYRGTYKGLYCVGCEEYKTESDLQDGLCPIHKMAPKELSEENYFFRLGKYKDQLLKHIESNPEFIQPKSRRNEIISYIKNHLADISISRKNMDWGIPVPGGDKKEVLYVWFDALINYLSAVGIGSEWWPADLHLVGKDIIKFHCALWPAMLMSAGLPLPKKVFAHGFFTINGQKISKTLGNTIDPVSVANLYTIDGLRYFLLREIPFGEDGDFSEEHLKGRYTSDLAHGLGNLVSRVLTMAVKYLDGIVPPKVKGHIETWGIWEESLENLSFHKALEATWETIAGLDRMINKEEPWILAKTDTERLRDIMYILLESLRNIAWMIMPFMPESADKILDQLGIKNEEKKKNIASAQKWGGLTPGIKIKTDEALWPLLT